MSVPTIREIMTLILAAVLTLLTATLSFAASSESEILLLPSWKTGDKIEYEIVKRRRKHESGRVSLDTKSTTELVVSILEKRDDHYQLKWTLRETRLDSPEHANNPMARKMSNLMQGFSLHLELDEVATIQDVLNWKELQAKALEALKDLTIELQRSGLAENQVELVRQQVRGMFSTKEQVEQLCLNEPRMFMHPMGRSYPLGSSIEYDDLLPNPFGGEPFPTVGVFVLQEYDKQKRIAHVIWKQTFDSQAVAKIMDETVKKIAQKMGKPMKQFDSLKNFSIEDNAEFFVDAKTGWLVRLKHVRTTKTSSGKQEDTLIIRRRESRDLNR